MNDRPDARELLEAVRRFLADEAVPALNGHVRYQARVAANVVATVARELESEPAHREAEWQGLAELFDESGAPPAAAIEIAPLGVDPRHSPFTGRAAQKCYRIGRQRVRVIRVHMRDDSRLRLGQRVGCGVAFAFDFANSIE